MRTLPLVVALAALGAAAFAVVTALGLSRELRDRADFEASVDARLATLETTLATGPRSAAPRAVAGTEPGQDAGADSGGADPAATGGPGLAAGRRSASGAELERRLAALEARAREERAPAPATAVAPETLAAGQPVEWLGSVDDAARHLELTASQRGDFERVLADAKRDVDALRKLPDEAGTTWETVEKDVVRMENGAIHFDASRLTAFREKVIPGRNESFGGAMRRIREDAARRMKETLTPAQRERFDKAQTQGLLPGSSDDAFGMVAFSTIDVAPTVTAPTPDAK